MCGQATRLGTHLKIDVARSSRSAVHTACSSPTNDFSHPDSLANGKGHKSAHGLKPFASETPLKQKKQENAVYESKGKNILNMLTPGDAPKKNPNLLRPCRSNLLHIFHMWHRRLCLATSKCRHGLKLRSILILSSCVGVVLCLGG